MIISNATMSSGGRALRLTICAEGSEELDSFLASVEPDRLPLAKFTNLRMIAQNGTNDGTNYWLDVLRVSKKSVDTYPDFKDEDIKVLYRHPAHKLVPAA